MESPLYQGRAKGSGEMVRIDSVIIVQVITTTRVDPLTPKVVVKAHLISL
jgi:hypothetical protein